MRKYAMAQMTQPELAAAFEQQPVVFVPMGSLENQGPQLFMGDFLMAERIAGLAAERAQAAGVHAVVAPVIPFGCWDAFAGAPGCLTLSPATFRGVLRDVLGALVQQGAQRIVILNGHGGNVEPIYEVTNAIYEERGVIVPSVYLWKAAFSGLVKAVGKEEAFRTSGHGANALGSVAMHLFPEQVRTDLAEPPQPRGEVLGLPASGYACVRFRGVDIDVPVSLRETTTNGVSGGDMRACSAEVGAKVTEELVALVADLAAHLVAQTPQA
ncbi:MAG: creatininase family protein [Phenylobacterium sp.]